MLEQSKSILLPFSFFLFCTAYGHICTYCVCRFLSVKQKSCTNKFFSLAFLFVSSLIIFILYIVFCSYYDPYRGVIVYFRVIDGAIKKGDRIFFMASGKVPIWNLFLIRFCQQKTCWCHLMAFPNKSKVQKFLYISNTRQNFW